MPIVMVQNPQFFIENPQISLGSAVGNLTYFPQQTKKYNNLSTRWRHWILIKEREIGKWFLSKGSKNSICLCNRQLTYYKQNLLSKFTIMSGLVSIYVYCLAKSTTPPAGRAARPSSPPTTSWTRSAMLLVQCLQLFCLLKFRWSEYLQMFVPAF